MTVKSPAAVAHVKAVQRNYKQNLRPPHQRDMANLRTAWNELPDHPTKPTLDQLEEWIHDATCSVCGKTKAANKKALALDHNHSTGEFRGFLCCDCNLLLGYAQDNIDLLKKAIAYLENPPSREFI